MFLLTKAFKLRDKANTKLADKSFLEHLEDLRLMVTRIVVTLLIATITCYALKDTLMDLLRRPIVVVWEQNQQARLPQTINPDTWEKAKRASHYSSVLSEKAKASYFAQFDNPKLSFYAQCAGYYRAARSLEPHEKRLQFIQNLPNISEKEKKFTLDLLKDETLLPDAKVDAKNNVIYMRSLKPTETFMLSLKLAFFAGIIVSFPFILVFILQFVLPGLKENEKKALWPALAIGFGLFLSGVFFCYFMVLPKALEFFYTYSGSMGVENEWRIGEYIIFATQFTLIFGLAFELPVVVMTLVKIGILDYDIMSRTRSYAIVSIFIIAAIITPTGDALTLCMLTAPMTLLYEICIWFAYFTSKKELEQEAAEMANYHSLLESAPGSLAAGHNRNRDHDTEYFSKSPEEQTDSEGEELDDGVSDSEDDSEQETIFNTIRAPYDPFADEITPGAKDEDDTDAEEPKEETPKDLS